MTELPRNLLHAFSHFILLTIFYFATCSHHPALAQDPKTAIAETNFEKQYQVAKEHLAKLESDGQLGSQRKNWLMGVRAFRKLYLADPGHQLAPACVFNMAKMHSKMFQLFQQPIDIDEALTYYHDVSTLFAQSSLADDALMKSAEIYLLQKKDPKQAAEIYQKILSKYPNGDMQAEASKMLQELSENHDIGLQNDLNDAGFSKNLVNVLPVKYWSSDEYTRIVIRTSKAVRYTSNLLEQNGDQPRRLYIDFAQSYTPPKFRAPVPIQDGLLKQIRTGQFDPSTVRVVLDIESISNYKIFSLNDPFRVIVDVHGAKKKSTSDQPLTAQQQPEQKPEQKTGTPSVPPETQAQPEQTTKQTVAQARQPQVSPGTQTTPQERTPEPDKPESHVMSLQDDKKKKPLTGTTRKGQPDSGITLSLAQQLGLGVKRIVIDPGHGGKDPGAMAFGLKEKDIVLSIARNVAKRLQDQYGYEVIMTRNSDTYLPLEERTAIANTRKADLFVSIHINAHPNKSVGGIETFFLNLATNTEAMRVAARENATSTHNISDLQNILADLMQNSKIEESSRLAEYVNTSLVSGLDKSYKIKNLGVKQAPFYVLIGAEMPSILAEVSFITNPKEAKLLQQGSYLSVIAQQIADGVAGYVDHHVTAALKM